MIAECTPQPVSPASENRSFFKLLADIASRRDLSPASKIILAVIADRIGPSGCCWPSIRGLAAASGTCPDTVQQAILALEAAGLLVIERGGFRTANRYRLGADYVRKSSTCGDSARAENPDANVLVSSTSCAGFPSLSRLTPDRLKKKPCRRARRRTAEKAPTDPRVKQFIDWFAGRYAQVLGRSYVVSGGKDGATVKRLLGALDREGLNGQAMASLQRAAQNMLTDPWGGPRADLGLLGAKFNGWRAEAPAQPGNGQAGSRGTLPAVKPTREFPRGLDFSKPQGAASR